jgi:hypothetical protein
MPVVLSMSHNPLPFVADINYSVRDTHQPESHMVRAGIGLALPAAARDVARAVLVGAEE